MLLLATTDCFKELRLGYHCERAVGGGEGGGPHVRPTVGISYDALPLDVKVTRLVSNREGT